MPLPVELRSASSILSNPTNLNIVVGRNGAGKSRFLRSLYALRNETAYRIAYVSPERAGVFKPDPNVEVNALSSPGWLQNTRDKNQAEGFKNASANKLKQLWFIHGQRLDDDPALRADFSKTFETRVLAKINGLLSNVRIERSTENGGEFLFKTLDGSPLTPDQLSSGESEAISLGAEILDFFWTLQKERINILLLDEPDVHLHPDLQARLARFLLSEIAGLTPQQKESTAVCLATHSTPLICELSTSPFCSIGTKAFGVDTVVQRPIASELKKVSAFFGHPLSKCINDDVPVLLEGEDDERIWQQAARTSQGRLKIFPSLAFSVTQQGELEKFCDSLLSAIYDDPVAISIRDGDGLRGALPPQGCVRRFKLQCYAAENLLLTDEVLDSLGKSWPEFQFAAEQWCVSNPTHRDRVLVQALAASSDRCRDTKLKQIRTLIPAIAGSKKP